MSVAGFIAGVVAGVVAALIAVLPAGLVAQTALQAPSNADAPAAPIESRDQGGPQPAATDSQANYRLDITAPDSLVQPIRERTLIGRWRNRSDYDPDQFDSLFARLAEEVQGLARLQGYFSARVRTGGDSTAVQVEVDPGPQTRVRGLVLRLRGAINDEPSLATQVRGRWPMPESGPFLPERWEQAKRGLLEALQSAGFLRARLVSSSAEIDPERASADLEVTIDSGVRLVFGALRVGGLERYEAGLVENLRTFRQGEPYSFDLLVRMQARLSQVGYFTSATVTPDIDAIEQDPTLLEVPILVEVREIQSRRLALGAGFSTDNGARVQLGLDQRNLFGSGWQAESVLLVESSRQRLFANVRSPLSPEARYIGLGSSLDRQDLTGERVLRTSTYGGIGQRRVDGDGFLSLTHQSELRRLEAGAGQGVERDTRMAWVLGYTHTLNRVDSVIDPQKGYALSAQLSGASRNLGSDRSFVRTYARGRHFWPISGGGSWGGGTLIGLAEFGAVFAGSREDIPTENLFRTGGAQSLRGYRYLSIGVPQAGAVTGGRYLVLGSLEYQQPIANSVKAALFYDRGTATDSLSGFTTYAGYGTGVRWKTPVGPIMVDVAWGDDSRRPRLHLAVGYGF